MVKLTFPHALVLLSALISAVGASSYIRDILQGLASPNRMSWLLWMVTSLVGAAAALHAGADVWTTTRVFLSGANAALILGVSLLVSRGKWAMTRSDLACGALATAATTVWFAVNSPKTAIALAALGYGCATFPTLVKAWTMPTTETAAVYLAGLVSAVLVFPAIPRWDIENSAFQAYLLILNVAILLALYRERIGAAVARVRKVLCAARLPFRYEKMQGK